MKWDSRSEKMSVVLYMYSLQKVLEMRLLL